MKTSKTFYDADTRKMVIDALQKLKRAQSNLILPDFVFNGKEIAILNAILYEEVMLAKEELIGVLSLLTGDDEDDE